MIVASGTIVGKYRVEKLLAQGGMGSIWIAVHEQLDSRVALKFMDQSLGSSPDARQRFEREAKAAAKLRSPHVVQVLDYGVEDDVPYIAMELLQGEDLGARLARVRRLSLGEASSILTGCCKALRLAHEEGIIHRDLKPSNIFITRSGDDEIVKILDFGIAKATKRADGDDSTKSGTVLGSPSYMSPEQARGGDLDARTDLWSMGVILFRAITGEKPFSGTAMVDVLVRICTDPLPVPSVVAPHLPAEIDLFFERALARDREKRFQSARAMADELQAIAAKYPELAPPIAAPPTLLESHGSKGFSSSSEPRRERPAPAQDATKSLRRDLLEPQTEVAEALPEKTRSVVSMTPPPEPTQARGKRGIFLVLGCVGVVAIGALAMANAHRAESPAALTPHVGAPDTSASAPPSMGPVAVTPAPLDSTAASPGVSADAVSAPPSSAASAKSSPKSPRARPAPPRGASQASPPTPKAGPNPVLGI